MITRAAIAAMTIGLALAGCQGREDLLPGEREPIRDETEIPATEAGAQLALPASTVNADWAQRHGALGVRVTNPTFSAAPQLVWAAEIGAGDARRARLIAAPIVAGGLIYTLDAAGRLGATTTSGATAWSRSIVPPGQQADNGPGGGMAVAGGVLFVATGFGEVMALNPSTGGEFWRVQVDGPVRAAPTVADGRVFVVARSDTAYAFDASDGTLLWLAQAAGGPGVLGGASPASDGQLVVAPFASGEVLGLLARNGLQVWGTAVTGGRRELVRNRISDITGDPVIDGGVIYASNQSGRTVQIERATGERNWTMPEGAYGPAWPVGGSVFLLSDQGALVRADAANGALIWTTQLPEWTNQRRRDAVVHHGPILAGGRLWVASSDGLLRAFSPVDGTLVASVPLPGGAAAMPAVARGVMYVVTRDGRLLAFQ